MRRLCHWARRARPGPRANTTDCSHPSPSPDCGVSLEAASVAGGVHRMNPRCVPSCIRARNWTRTSTPLSGTATSTLRVYHSTIRAKQDRLRSDHRPRLATVLSRCVCLSYRDRGQEGPLPARRLPHRGQLAIRLVTARSGHDPDFQEHTRRCATVPPERFELPTSSSVVKRSIR